MMIKLLNFRFVVLLGILGFTSIQLSAQDFSRYNWYFGQSSNAIRFSRSDNSPSLVTKTPLGQGGSAVATNEANANLLFYTDGNTVYDVTHSVMTNGNALGGDVTKNQPVAIAPVPGTDSLYIFSITAANQVVYAIVEMSEFGNAPFPTPAIGAVVSKNNVIAALSNRSEAMLTIPHANGTDYWLITQQRGTDNYLAMEITATGPPFNLVSSINVTGPLPNGLPITAANFAYHEGLGKVAVTPQDINRNIAILNFDNAAGTFSLDQFIINSAGAIAQDLYDTEWSPSGRFLYYSKGNQLLQYDLNNPGNSAINILPTSLAITKSYGLQYAPDSAIYHLYDAGGAFNLGKITDTDSLGLATLYSTNAFSGNPNFNGRQFPSFASIALDTPSVTFTTAGTCLNSPISFYPTVTPGADSLVWDLGDGTTTSEWSPIHTYTAAPGNVTVTPYLNGVAGTPATQALALTNFNLQLTLVQDTTACSCSLPFPDAGAVPLQAAPDPSYCNPFTVTAQASGGISPTYQWYGPGGALAGETSLTFQPDSAGYYWLVATDGTCSTYAGVNIREYNIQDQRANVWYFGNGAGLDFNNQPVTAISNPTMNAPEGTATISDRNGQVLFFTDGNTVWNRAFTEIGTGIGGDILSAQSSIIIPVPGDETLYYIFTTQDVGAGRYELRYSLYDIKANNGAGGLIEFNQLLFSPVTERMTSDGNWLIVHEYGNNSFRAYQITGTGIGNPVISSVGSDHSFSPTDSGEGYMKVSGSELAVALSTASGNFVEIFDFDNATGVVSNFRSVDLGVSGQVYGIEFSGDKIFATISSPGNSYIAEILDTLGTPPALVQPPLNVSAELGAIQMGPDGQLYVAVNGASALGVINVNSDPATASTFTLAGSIPLTGTSTLGLPNFIQSVGTAPTQPTILVTGLCEGSPTDFSGSGTDPIDTFLWSVRQGATLITSSDQQAFSYTLPSAGTYFITLQISNGCGYRATLYDTITIVAPPIAPNPVESICTTGATIVLDADPANAGNLTFLWSTGEITETISVNRQGNYSVTITNPEGCIITPSILVIDSSIPMDLGTDQDICSQTTGSVQLDGQINTNNHDWYLSTNGGPFVSLGNNTQLQNASLVTPGVFSYLDIWTNPLVTDPSGNPCVSRDTITFTISETPVIAATAAPIACVPGNNGQIQLNINSPVSLFTYTLFPPTGTTTVVSDLIANPTPAAPYNVPSVANLVVGSYGLQVTDQVSGCTNTTIVTISSNAFTVIADQPDDCPDSHIRFSPSINGDYTYTIRDVSLNVLETNTLTYTGTPLSSINVFPSGNYSVELLSAGSCTAADTVLIMPRFPLATIAFDLAAICTGSSVSATDATLSYSWSTTPGSGINGPNNLQTVTLNPGMWKLIVTGSGAGLCPATDSINVTVDGPLTVDFTQSDACADQVTLTGTVSVPGTFVYNWSFGGSTIANGNPTVVTQNGNYDLLVVSSFSGCSYPVTKNVDVIGLQTITITSELACEGLPFILTASPSNPVSSPYTWARNGSVISSGASNQVSVTGSGNYTVSSNILTCPVTATIPITTLPTPVGGLPDRAFICNDPRNPDCQAGKPEPNSCLITLDAGGGFVSYEWFEDGISNGNTSQTFLVTVPEITYSVLMEHPLGCFGTDQTVVIEQCKPFIVAPTAFRPGSQVVDMNGGLANNAFRVFPIFIDDNSFQIFIYNRWGELIFQSNDPDFRWNGSLNNSGSLLPPGTYTYIVKYKGLDSSDEKEHRGGVVLVR